MYKGKDICGILWCEGAIFMDNEISSLEIEAFSHLKLGNFLEAQTKFEEIIAKYPNSSRSKHNLAKFFIHTEAYNDALSELANISDSLTNSEILWKDKGLVYYKLGNHSKALDCIVRSLKIDNNFIPALLIKSKIYSKDNNLTKALSILDIIFTIDSSNRDALYQRGNLFFINGNAE